MASINKVIVVGNLGKDPETRFLPDGKAVCNFSVVAVSLKKKKATNEKKEATEWHRISSYGRLAEICGEYLKKGSQVYVEGKLRTRKWQDKEGQDRYTTEIIADVMQMLGSRSGMGAGEPREMREPSVAGESKPAKKPVGQFQDMDDDIPF